MADLTFSQPERRNFFVPIALAVVVLALASALLIRFTPHRIPVLIVKHTSTWQAHTIFKSDSILVGQDKAQDDLYVLATLRIQDPLKVPLFLKDFTGTLTTASGETLSVSAAEKLELPALYETFPALKSLASTPLLREAAILPGRTAEGMILLHFPVTEDAWSHRQSATLTVDFYHQGPQSIALPVVPPSTNAPPPDKSSSR